MLKRSFALAAASVIAAASLSTPDKQRDTAVFAADSIVEFTELDSSFNGGEPIRGVDISSIISIEESGVLFRDDDGKEADIFKLLADHGVNYIRVRVWNEPNDGNGNSYGGGNNDVKTAGIIGKRAAEYGMKLLVDIQYSDFWADPAKQTRPKYWAEHDHDTLKGEIYKWTHWVLESITADGGDICMVQVGNETNCFFCGEIDMYQICDLFASGNQAVRDFDPDILIAHHFANPSNVENYKWYAQVMNECGLDYDVFATSYYPYWHGTTENLTSVLKYIGDTYQKYVMVAETAYPYTDQDVDKAGGSSYDNQALFDFSGKPLSSLDVFMNIYPHTETMTYILGDVNGDGSVNVFDLILLRRQLVSGNYSLSADLTGSGNVEISDLVMMQRYLLGREKFTPEERTVKRRVEQPQR